MNPYHRTNLLWVPFAFVALGIAIAGVYCYVVPKQYQSTANITISPSYGRPDVGIPTPRPIVSPPSAIVSKSMLNAVAKDLDLSTRWGLTMEQSVTRLGESTDAYYIRDSPAIGVDVKTDNPVDAREIAERLIANFEKMESEREARYSAQIRLELANLVAVQEMVIEEDRQSLADLVGGGVRYDPHSADRRKFQKKWELQLDRIRSLRGNELLLYVSQIDLPENILKSLYPQYLDAVEQLGILLDGGLASDHPSVQHQQAIVDGIRRDLDEGVIAVRETIQAQLELLREKHGHRDQVPPAIERQSFEQLRSEYEESLQLLGQLKAKQLDERIRQKTSEPSVIVLSKPLESRLPISPDIPLALSIGGGSGLLAGLIFAFPLLALLNRKATS